MKIALVSGVLALISLMVVAMTVVKEMSFETYEASFTDTSSIVEFEKKQAPVAVSKPSVDKATLPKVIAPSAMDDAMVIAAEKRSAEDNASCEIQALNFSMPEYPEREKSDKQRRAPSIVTADNVFTWITTPEFFAPDALKGVEDRVVEAKKRLNALFESGEYKRLLSPREIVAIICRETCSDDEKALVDLNCLGDRGMVGFEKAHGILQFSQRAYRSVDAVKGLGLIGPDFHGDLALSELMFQAWIYEHCNGLNFEGMARSWNAGPSGYADHGRAYGYFHGDNRKGVKQYLEKIVLNLPSVVQYDARPSEGEQMASSLNDQYPTPDQAAAFYGAQPDTKEKDLVFVGPAGYSATEPKEGYEEVFVENLVPNMNKGGVKPSKKMSREVKLPSWDENPEITTVASNP